MEIYSLSKADFTDLFDPNATISELFVWLETDFMMQNKLVCQFVINGHELTEGDELDWAAKPLESVQSMIVKVQGEKDLVLDVIEAWVDALPEMIQFIENMVEAAHGGSRKFHVKEILKLIHQQETFVSSLMSLKSPLKKFGLRTEAWEQGETTLLKYAKECVQHLQAKNFVQLIETLEYDGAHALEQWRLILSEMKVKMKADVPAERPLLLSGATPGNKPGKRTAS